jgi:hypothetical protein
MKLLNVYKHFTKKEVSIGKKNNKELHNLFNKTIHNNSTTTITNTRNY